MDQLEDRIKRAVSVHLPGRTVQNITDRGVWERHIVEVVLEWSIYLERDNHDWYVTKISPMAELMWWDSAFNLALLQYPPFGRESASRWEAFLRSYGSQPERKRVLLYLVMQRLCAAMGIYKAPINVHDDTWAAQSLKDLDVILNEIARL